MPPTKINRYLLIEPHLFQISTSNRDMITILEQRWLTFPQRPITKTITIIDLEKLIKNNQNKVSVYSHSKAAMLDFLDFLLMVEIEKYLLKEQIFFLHASAIQSKNQAVVFIGPTGAGKTTITERFKKQAILAEDTVIIKKINNRFFLLPAVFDRIIKPTNHQPIVLGQINYLQQSTNDLQTKLSLTTYLGYLLENNLFVKNYGLVKKDQRLYKLLLALVSYVPGYKLSFKKAGALRL